MKKTKYNELGSMLRKIRVDREETQKTMAENLGISGSYLSAIEMGKRPIPDGFIEKLSTRYTLTPAERRTAIRAASVVSVLS